MRWLAVLAIALVACKFDPKIVSVEEAGVGHDAPEDARADAAIDGPVDASVTCNSSACASDNGTCNGDTCEVVAVDNSSVTCPPGNCSVACPSDTKSCHLGMTCPSNSTCVFHCDADHTCNATGVLTCGSGSTCELFCKGNHACDALTINCTNATCILHCCGNSSCQSFVCVAGCSTGAPTCP